MASSSLRRQMKNIVHNYSDAEVKVREATSNDPWGPSTTLMSEIAQMTYQSETYHEVMIMVWKRLNDSGKNWRHVYKGLTLLDYLIKNGPNKVVQECNENIFSVQTLKDFQFFDRDGKDNGINVREKAKQIVALLKDEERLKQERAQAQATRRRMSQVTSALDNRHRIRFNEASVSSDLSPDLEQARPQSTGEEELQLQLALAMSREEAEKKKEPSAPDAEEDSQLQAALSQSKEEFEKETKFRQGEISVIEKALIDTQLSEEHREQEPVKKNETHMSDLIDIFGPPPSSSSNVWDSQHASSLPPPSSDAFFPAWRPPSQNLSTSASCLPWDIMSHGTQLKEDNTSQSIIFSCEAPSSWEKPQAAKSSSSDPWGEKQKGPEKVIYDIFSPPSPTQDTQSPSSNKTDNSFELDFFGDSFPTTKPALDSPDLKAEEALPDTSTKPRSNTPELFLEPAARSLVNLNSLIVPASTIKVKNPFLSGPATPSPPNPFQAGDLRPSMNQMRTASPVPAPITGPPSMLTPMPANPMDTGMNGLRTLPPMPGFPMLSSSPIPVHPFPTTMSLPPTLGYPYTPFPVLNQLPVTLPQPITPGLGSPKTGTNPFL